MTASALDGVNPGAETIRAAVRRLADREPELVVPDAPLSDLTTFRIGGPALGLCRIRTPRQAQRFQAFADERGLPRYCLGAGSNILADDDGFCGLIFRLEIDTFQIQGRNIVVGAGASFDDIIRRTLDGGLTGLEFASGIPGTVGGALVGNAGCYGHEIGEFLVEAVVLRPDGTIECLGPDEMGFGYRHTRLSDGPDLLLQATLRLSAGDTTAAEAVRREHLASRATRHPQNLPCAGSYFRNLPPLEEGGRRRAAGALLDRAGVQDFREGDAAVFEKHANIIVNRGGASCREVLALADRMRRAVHDRFEVDLTPEVRHLPWRRAVT